MSIAHDPKKEINYRLDTIISDRKNCEFLFFLKHDY
jgi:hypothetical protein